MRVFTDTLFIFCGLIAMGMPLGGLMTFRNTSRPAMLMERAENGRKGEK